MAGCSASSSVLVEAVREGWGDGPVGKMLTMQVRGAEFNPPELLQKYQACWQAPVVPALGRQEGP